MNYTNNKLLYKREEKATTPTGENIDIVGGLWEKPIQTINKNEIRAEIAFKNAETNMIWANLRSYNFENEGELNSEIDAIVKLIESGEFK